MSYTEQMHYCIQKIKEMADQMGRVPLISDFNKKYPNINIVLLFGTYDGFLRAAGVIEKETEPTFKFREPKILVLDIETKPLKVFTFGIRDQYINIEQIIEDWSVMSWAAKIIGKDEVFYQDVSKNSDYTDDELIIRGIWELMNDADIIVGQNSIRFDIPKLNGKFEKYKLGPPSPYKSVDTYRIKKKLGLTSNKLEYSTEYYNERFKKLKHSKFPGFSLWKECLNGNQEAWAEMKKYNIHDVLATEELYLNTLRKWDKSINYGVFTGTGGCTNCGSDDLTEKEHGYTKTGAFKTFLCNRCGSYSTSKNNELSKATKSRLMK